MKKILSFLFSIMMMGVVCFANSPEVQIVQSNAGKKLVQVYVEGSSVWEKKTLEEFKMSIENKFPKDKFIISLSDEFAAAVEVYRDDEPFFTDAVVKNLAMRTQDWQLVTKKHPCDYVLYCKIVRGDAKSKGVKLIVWSKTKVEMDCTLRLFNVDRGEYTYATKYRTIGTAHNTSNFERAERKAIMEAFDTMKLDLTKI